MHSVYSLLTYKVCDCGKVIRSSSDHGDAFAFDRTGCSQLSQKVVQRSSFSILIVKFLSVFWQKDLYIPMGFDQNFISQHAVLFSSKK